MASHNLHKNLSLREAKRIAHDLGATFEIAGYGDLIFKYPGIPYVRTNSTRKDAGPDVINFLKKITKNKETQMTGFRPNTIRHHVAEALLKALKVLSNGATTHDVKDRVTLKLSASQVSNSLSQLRAGGYVKRQGDYWYATSKLVRELTPVQEQVEPQAETTPATPPETLPSNFEHTNPMKQAENLISALSTIERMLEELTLQTTILREDLLKATQKECNAEIMRRIQDLTDMIKGR